MASESANKGGSHRWRFFRAGGFDQVRLDAAGDLLALEQLDQKLWAALACPAKGIEFDARTLQLIDSDSDGRIRAPEVIAAVNWATVRLRQPEDLCRGASELVLTAIDESRSEGKQLVAAAKQILKNLGKPDALAVTFEDTADVAKIFAKTKFNGDGIVPPEAADDDVARAAIKEIVDLCGGVTDRRGTPGIDQAKLDQFFTEAKAFDAWWRTAEADTKKVWPLGDATASAAGALAAVKDKIEDYFLRCNLAAFDGRATVPLNRSEAEYAALGARSLVGAADEVKAFPIARIDAGRPLPLDSGVNPAWAAPIARLNADAVKPLLGAKNALTQAEWQSLVDQLAPYHAWQSGKTGALVEKLGSKRVRELLESGVQARLADLIAKDKALEPEANAIADVDRLLHYQRDLFKLLNNFVSFHDFYKHTTKAVFQVGTLYIDGRSCDLCVRVDDAGKHGALASLSRTYLVYCDCTRRGSTDKMTIAAAITAGDSDQLMVGRNGVFYDRQGQDWDAAITKIVEHPISIRQAFWSPYKKIARMIGEQIQKFATSREKAVQDKAAANLAAAGTKVEAGKPATAPAAPFDVGKFAGIFAAIGLALGMIGTAIAAVLTGFIGLRWWQMLLALVAIVLAISGPSMLIAWFKLRERNLGPILDANGWAINTRAKINIPFGRSLTAMAKLPAGAERSLKDPFAEKKQPWALYIILLGIVVAAVVLWQKGYLREWIGLPPATPAIEAPLSPAAGVPPAH